MKKLSKKAELMSRRLEADKNFQTNFRYCINNGIHISPECIVNKAKWRMVIEIVDKDGGLIEKIQSDPVFYTSVPEYELKQKELLAFYAKPS